ncbi:MULTISPECIES: PRC-barrel domain-containing protein [Sulfitobacter]|jgi:sporulation protein YlmC with PRC-barrel domain|uniref:PRC-barrel domain-containing protein n=1 Tax=Sulfitobacter profundi TaxID=2679961 RepID=A0ABW1Z2P8_9RHOB|nr:MULTISPECIES: PRC-barrel domain-containing protein [Sulfitobacter]UWR36511.1 PRC-barrel domain-containing protein [Sulfitobacter sp. W074]
MTNFMQHASRLAMIAVLGAAPLAATAQDATKPASDEATAEAPQTDEATQSSEATASDDAVEADTETDTAEAPEGEAELEADTAEAPEADADKEADTAGAPDTDAATDSAEAPATTEPMTEDTAEAPATEPLGDTVAPADTTAEAPSEEPAKPVEGQITMQSENTILADDLIGSNVYSDAGEKIGDVDDLIVNLDGTVEGVVIGVGGFLGMGEKWVAVKMDSLSTMTDESGTLRLVSSATKTDLEAAEAFKTAQDMEAEQQALENAAPQDPNAVTTEPAPVN